MGIPNDILAKGEQLTAEEFETLKTHTTIGHNVLSDAEKNFNAPVDFLKCAKQMTLSHEEIWAGSGYPRGLSGEEIPIPARLIGIVDAYDAVISDGVSHEEALRQIGEGKGSRFDPDVADAFVAIGERIAKIVALFPAN